MPGLASSNGRLAGGSPAVVHTGTVDAADAQERVRWKLASSYGSNLDVLGRTSCA